MGFACWASPEACSARRLCFRDQHDFRFEFLGLVGLADPVRPNVPAAVEECSTAGIRVVMITGDHPTTAKSIAVQAGIKPVDEIITGPELEKMDDPELRKRISQRECLRPHGAGTETEAGHTRSRPTAKSLP